MPTYDYECSQCHHQWEVFQSITAKPLRKCPECGKLKAKRIIGAGGGIIFKGSGFYETDYRSSSYKKAAEADSKAQAASSESKSAKSDSGSSTKSASSDS
ncbi:FmdB family zinc ribbon protein [Gimesia panareensis]|uniref:Zinc ribbon domain protein n=1 Tax=Gimesia panareensis TaxID=2527978 RepID=A0A518AD32_9PLAN|nr:FmdB family zinc ribbon protein [Gimesia panareensis]QDT29572.1 Zinc ribbon domain protein [Gimesia panareensis]QDU52616.1 Zinc ribbon domain protein [Gimesia panareensis]